MWVAYDAESMDVLADGSEQQVRQYAGADLTVIAASEDGWRRAIRNRDRATLMSANPPRRNPSGIIRL